MANIDWQTVQQELVGLEIISEPNSLARLSLDYFHFSPILKKLLENKRGDLVVRPINEAEVIKIAKICVKHRIALTVRGAGTGNYGQAVPLEGGIILDTTHLNKIIELSSGLARVESGCRMASIDRETQKLGWELRMIPSTYQSASIGGFIGGGSVGSGSLNYGLIKELGNVRMVRLVTLEDEPRIIELRGKDIEKVMHAYGTNGIITEIELPLAPAYNWREIIVVFPNLMQAAYFGQALAQCDGIIKKSVTVFGDPIPSYFKALENYLPKGCSCALLAVEDSNLEFLKVLIDQYEGAISYNKGSSSISLLEFTWNHTTLLARTINSNLTYLQVVYFDLNTVEDLYKKFARELFIHLEFIRIEGKVIPTGLPLVQFTSEQRLEEIIKYHKEHGATIANPHTYFIEDGGTGDIDPAQIDFKKLVDPYGLMNPGKIRAYIDIANLPKALT